MYKERAGFGERLIAYLIDSFIIGLIVAIPSGCLGGVYAVLMNQNRSVGFGEALVLSLVILILLIALVGSFLYYGLMWSRSGQTLGKKMMGIQVVSVDGQLPSYWKSIGRAVIGYGISGIAFDLGFLWMLWDDQKQTWHDKLFKTFVVKV
ncbi:MAG: RDD family protein [Anaerolineae bacterium]|nr:RDD family protein [Anaerolineae bacterium]